MSARPLHWPDEVLPQVPQGIPLPEDADCAVFLLGPIRVFRHCEPIVGGWRLKALELLAYLAVHPFGAAKDQILEGLWPEGDPKLTQKYLWHTVSHLRSRLRGGGCSTIRLVEKTDNFYRLDFKRVWVDVVAFEFGVRMEEPDSHEEVLRLACDLYKGEFCEGRYFAWASGFHEHLSLLYTTAIRRLSGILRDRGAVGLSLELIDRAMASDPYDEDLCRLAMSMDALQGRVDRAAKRFWRLRRLLIEDLGVEPSSATLLELERLRSQTNHTDVVVGPAVHNPVMARDYREVRSRSEGQARRNRW